MWRPMKFFLAVAMVFAASSLVTTADGGTVAMMSGCVALPPDECCDCTMWEGQAECRTTPRDGHQSCTNGGWCPTEYDCESQW